MKYIKVVLLFVFIAFGWHKSKAYDFRVVNGLCYNFNEDGTSVTVTYMKDGNNGYGYYDWYSCVNGELIIPSSVTYNGNTYSVTAIGKYAFDNCNGLTSVTIPSSVTSIGESSFGGCDNLKSISWLNSNVTTIGSSAFASTGLTSVTIPNSVTTIDSYAFSYCKGLTSLIIGNSVKTIGGEAFYYCSSLASITIGSSVTSIGNWAFQGCENLNEVHIFDITAWCRISFVSNDSNPLKYAHNLYLNGSKITNLVIPNSVTEIKPLAFDGCSCLTSVTIPNSVATIGGGAFGRCTGLTEVTIPNSVTTINGGTFYNCTGLTSVTIPNSVTTIGSDPFWGCTGLNAVYITDIAAWCNIDFYDSLSNPLYYAHNLYLNGSIIKDLNIPNSVTVIKKSAFINCSCLTSLTIPNSVTQIGDYAFQGCSNLASIFWNAKQCSGSGFISDSAPFYSLNNVKSLTLGAEVESLPQYLCLNFRLTNLYSLIENPQNVSLGVNVFSNSDYSNCVLTVPATSLGKYRSTPRWSSFVNIQPDVYASSLILNTSNLFVENGKTENLIANVMPENAYSLLNWTSSNSSVVTVDTSGKITAKNVGTATITASTTDGSNLNSSCFVEVYNLVSNVKLDRTSLTLEKGEAKTIMATITPANAYNKKLLWLSSNPSVAEVDSTGLVTAINTGNTVISATTTDGSNITATCNVEVRVYANAVIINKHETSIYAGGTEQLTAQVLPEDAYNTTVTWRTTNYNIATVTSNGLVSAYRVGTAQIIATCNGISDTCVVNVMGITNLTLDKHESTLDIESIETLNVTIEPEEAINKNLSWRSLNTSIATVSNTGLITPRGIGSTRIIVQTTDGSNLSDTCIVTVIPTYDLYPTTTELTHVRGQSDFSAVIPFWMSNKTAISGLQFDITLPTGVSFATVDDYPDVWIDASRKARNHTVDVNLISSSKYRVLVSSPTNNTFKGNEGVVLYMRLNVDSAHPIGSYYINTSNVIFVEPDETQHTGYNKSVKIDYKYLLGDADGDARVDIADYTVTALYILNRPTEVFYSDAANVNGDYNITVTDLVGITNISLGIRPQEYRPAPAVTMDNETQESMPSLNASMEGDNIVALSIDNDTPLAGMQLDLQLPQGMTLADATLEGRATKYQLGTNTIADGRVRLLISSFGDKDIETGNDAVIKLVLAGDNVNNEMLYITGAQAALRDLRSYELNDISLPIGSTSINDIGCSYEKLSIYGKDNTIVINSPSAMTVQLVHVNGMVVPVEIKPGHNTIEVGGHGVYIIRVGNSAYKVRL